jgi:hypothetical protein
MDPQTPVQGRRLWRPLQGILNVNDLTYQDIAGYITVESKYFDQLSPEEKMQIGDSTNSNNSYDIYIVVKLDIEKYKFFSSVRTTNDERRAATRSIVWRWGSEKRFFDYLNVLCEELGEGTLNTYIQRLKGYGPSKDPIQVLGELWRKYRNKSFEKNEQVPNFDALRNTKIMEEDLKVVKRILITQSENGEEFNRTAANLIDVIVNNTGGDVLSTANTAITTWLTNLGINGDRAYIATNAAPGILNACIQAARATGTIAGDVNQTRMAIETVICFATPAAPNSLAGTVATCTVESLVNAANKAIQKDSNGDSFASIAAVLAAGGVVINNEWDRIATDLKVPNAVKAAVIVLVNGRYGAGPVAAPVTEIIAFNAQLNDGQAFEYQVDRNITTNVRLDMTANMVAGDPTYLQGIRDLTKDNVGTADAVYNALRTFIDNKIYPVTTGPTGAAVNAISKNMSVLKNLMNLRNKLKKHNFALDPAVALAANNSKPFVVGGRDGANIIFTPKGKKYVLAIIDLFLMMYDQRELKGKDKVLYRDYLIAFIWNAYDPAINKGLSKSLKLNRYRIANDYYNNSSLETEQILYFRELRRIFGKFIAINRLYLAGSNANPTNNIRYVGRVGQANEARNNGTPLFANQNAYRSFIGSRITGQIYQQLPRLTAKQEAIKKYFANRFSNIIAAASTTPNAITNASLATRHLYADVNAFLTAISKLSKRYREIVLKVCEMAENSLPGDIRTNHIKVKVKVNEQDFPLYVRFSDLDAYVYLVSNRNKDFKNQFVTIFGTEPTVDIARDLIPNQDFTYIGITKLQANRAELQAAVAAIWELKNPKNEGQKASNFTQLGGKKKSSSSKSRSAKSKSSSSKSSKSTKSTKSKSTKSKSSKSTKTKKSRK